MSGAGATTYEGYQGRKYFLELDGLRALSVLLVISSHLSDDASGNWRWLSGFRGVTLFFVLSGFLITTLAMREEDRRGRLSLAAFYVRRCCRIFPLYYLTLAVYCLLILGLALGSDQAKPLWDALPYYLSYLQEIPHCVLLLYNCNLPFAQSWSLGIEEKFYLVWPLLAFVLWRGAARPRGAVALALGAALLPLLLTPLGPVGKVVAKMVFSYASLLAGCVLALLLHDPRWFARLRRLGGLGWTAAVLLLLLAAHGATPWLTSSPAADLLNIVYTLAATGLLACVLLGDGLLQRLLRWRPLVFVGRMSYGVYLIHMLCMSAVYKLFPALLLWRGGNLAAFPLTCLLSIAVAWGLHVAVESPCIELGRRWSRTIMDRAARRRLPGPVVPARAA
jgi:peptidoglycan/LPS O-acetylase OafA/YrhL